MVVSAAPPDGKIKIPPVASRIHYTVSHPGKMFKIIGHIPFLLCKKSRIDLTQINLLHFRKALRWQIRPAGNQNETDTYDYPGVHIALLHFIILGGSP
jgi:hypothetical protein